MNKEIVVNELIKNLEVDLEKAKAAFETSKVMTQNKDMAKEGKWDTRGIEAGYLASAHKKRADEIEMDLNMIKELAEELPESKSVSLGSLVEFKFNGSTRKYFITPTAGGTMLNINGEVILVISVFSPIGNEALGLGVSEFFEVETGDVTREYQVISIM